MSHILTAEGGVFLKICIKSMVFKDQFGDRHTDEDTLYRHKPHGMKKSEAEKALKWANKKGWMFRVKKQGEWHYSLNSTYKIEINEFLYKAGL